jgi:hypothetical protein
VTLITRTVPRVRKAVRWNTPFYGIEGPLDEEGLARWIGQAAKRPGDPLF